MLLLLIEKENALFIIIFSSLTYFFLISGQSDTVYPKQLDITFVYSSLPILIPTVGVQ